MKNEARSVHRCSGLRFCLKEPLYKMLSGRGSVGKIIMQKNTSLKKVELTY